MNIAVIIIKTVLSNSESILIKLFKFLQQFTAMAHECLLFFNF